MVDGCENAAAHLMMHNLVAKRKSSSRTSNRDNFAYVLELNVSASSSSSDKMSKDKIVWRLGTTSAECS